MTKNLLRKFSFNSKKDDYLPFFIQNGYLVFKNIFSKKYSNSLLKFILSKKKIIEKKYKSVDTEQMCVSIVDLLEKNKLYEEFCFNTKLQNILIDLLGQELCLFNFPHMWLNKPNNKNPVLVKTPHVDAWTGASTNSLFVVYMVTKSDEYNSISVYPGSHLLGLVPTKNRTINNEDFNIEFKNSTNLKLDKGDLIIWHSLLLHKTTGQSKSNERISITLRYSSTETPFYSQERSLGYRCINTGPLNTIKRYIGNDQLYPFRLYGGYPGIEQRLKKIYKFGNYKKTKKVEIE
jgi:ectoine hydroxylase-related dioxygenase (phytanoyl-CoA dioxygenase family)